MITKFKVSNFKGFNTQFVFNLKDTNSYTFNKESVKNGIVNNALIYGANAVGKSNLGLAMFDIINHLTDKQTDENRYSNYLNALNKTSEATFEYEFVFDENYVNYNYTKVNHKTIISESFSINGKLLASIDRNTSEKAEINFKGAETLKTHIPDNNLSLLKYIKNNSLLDDNNENRNFNKFFEFVDKMLFFRSLQDNMYLGIEVGSTLVDEDIIKKGNVDDLENFLNLAGINCKLSVVNESGKDIIAFDFNGEKIAYYKIASSGTISLILFYFWLQRLRENKISFLFIDEFDAFYHHELSELIISELKKIGIQFVLTTHNTSIISNDLLRPDCYFLMNNSAIKPLSKCTSKELREAHNLEKMYKAGAFNV